MKLVLHVNYEEAYVVELKRRPTVIILRTELPGGLDPAFTLHRNGGFSIPGWPRRGGTTLCWGQVKEHMELGFATSPRPENTTVYKLFGNRAALYIGEDF